MSKATAAVAGAIGGTGVVGLIILLICIAPMIFLWSLNTLFELGGSSIYIAHDLWSYFVALCFMATIRGGK